MMFFPVSISTFFYLTSHAAVCEQALGEKGKYSASVKQKNERSDRGREGGCMHATYADNLWALHMISSPPPGRLHHEPGGRPSFPEIQPKTFFLADDTSPKRVVWYQRHLFLLLHETSETFSTSRSA